jgi:hypothetical protein
MNKALAHVTTIHIEEGQSKRINCPICSGSKTFTLSKINGVVIYNCYKLGCTASGAWSEGITSSDIKKLLLEYRSVPTMTTVTPEALILPITLIYDISDPAMQRFINRWKLYEVPMMYDIVDERAVFLIYDSIGRLIDAVGRSLNGSIPKWRRYSNASSYYYYGRSNVAIVVEDAISACVANRATSYAATGVAILGTTLSAEHIEYLKQFSRVIVALDPDASMKTLQYTRVLANYVDSVKAIMLHDDIKYEVEEDIIKLKELIDADPRNS